MKPVKPIQDDVLERELYNVAPKCGCEEKNDVIVITTKSIENIVFIERESKYLHRSSKSEIYIIYMWTNRILTKPHCTVRLHTKRRQLPFKCQLCSTVCVFSFQALQCSSGRYEETEIKIRTANFEAFSTEVSPLHCNKHFPTLSTFENFENFKILP